MLGLLESVASTIVTAAHSSREEKLSCEGRAITAAHIPALMKNCHVHNSEEPNLPPTFERFDELGEGSLSRNPNEAAQNRNK